MISIVIPVKNGGEDLERCLAGIAAQRIDEEVEVVVVDSRSTDGSADVARAAGAVVEEIDPAEFGHGRTRNLGVRLAQGDLVVFTSQDAVAAGETWLARLSAAARSGPDVAGAYGRQLPHTDARPPERFFLDFLYGPEPRIQRVQDDEELTFESTLFSNVNAAVPRWALERFPFRDDLAMSEDQEWSRRALRAGFSLVYEPNAAVRHSHAYTIRSAFRRFFDSGVSAEHAYVEGEESRAALRRAGARYAREELAWLWRTGRRRWIPYTTVYELGKFAGLQLGLRHERLPRSLTRRLSAYDTG
ncbi:glycosyltransferase family 2 protein [Gaiella sp.]|uniref:glycosyltransferase family 2 protein n=1 Tax=Gaiella sp. TaxID=2663207 RepID=UPI002E32F9CE|nr:glycosyltransferase [Gaiella sp.]HEX5582541.1 glycosyltransferase [Gaiella sp.]